MSVIRGMESIANHEEKEEIEIEMEALLSSLLQEEKITGIEYRLIVSSNQLSDRPSAIFKILYSKNRREAVYLLHKFGKLNSRMNIQAIQQKKSASEKERNPLLMNTVITNLFEVLSLEDIKLCRLVCQQWNSTAEVWLRKKASINFKPGSLEPTAFLEIFKLSLPHLPFTKFIFSSSGQGNRWCTSELDEFFDKWGDNIKSLTFNQIYLKRQKKYDVTPWIEKARNLEKLKIYCCKCVKAEAEIVPCDSCHSSYRTALELQLDKGTSLKSLSAKNCIITLDPTKSSPRFTPLEIQLNSVTWKLRGGEVLDNITLNDFIDFGQAIIINVRNPVGNCKFDMACQVFDTRKFSMDDIHLFNWGTARGNIDLVCLYGLVIEAPNELNFQQLFFEYSTVNLTFLPQCIEKLYCSVKNKIILSEDRTIQLPNLNFLCYQGCGSRNVSDIGNFLSLFLNCVNLSELELVGESIDHCLTLDVDLLPRSVRKMKIRHVKFVGDNHYQLDTLIIEDNHFSPSVFDRTAKLMLKIRSRVLVLKCLKREGILTSTIIKFVKKNTQLESIVVGVKKGLDLHANVPFEGSILSRWVDEKSNYYRFENKRGQSLTHHEFKILSNLNGLDNPKCFSL